MWSLKTKLSETIIIKLHSKEWSVLETYSWLQILTNWKKLQWIVMVNQNCWQINSWKMYDVWGKRCGVLYHVVLSKIDFSNERKDIYVIPLRKSTIHGQIPQHQHNSQINMEELLIFREFEVDSNHFTGQVHRWRLSLLLQKGTRRAHNTLLDVSHSL